MSWISDSIAFAFNSNLILASAKNADMMKSIKCSTYMLGSHLNSTLHSTSVQAMSAVCHIVQHDIASVVQLCIFCIVDHPNSRVELYSCFFPYFPSPCLCQAYSHLNWCTALKTSSPGSKSLQYRKVSICEGILGSALPDALATALHTYQKSH